MQRGNETCTELLVEVGVRVFDVAAKVRRDLGLVLYSNINSFLRSNVSSDIPAGQSWVPKLLALSAPQAVSGGRIPRM